jgi:hypothetical protein
MRYGRSRGSTGRRFVHCSFGIRETGLVDGACNGLGGIDVVSELVQCIHSVITLHCAMASGMPP